MTVTNDQIGLINRMIRTVFGILMRNDFSPMGSKKGTREDLPKIWHDSGYRSGIEIGVQRGIFSAHILRTMPDVHLHSIDPWIIYGDSKLGASGHDRYRTIAMNTLKPFIDQGRCTVHQMKSMDAVSLFYDGSLDFVFIDGDHSFDACAMDLIKYVPKVRRGGMVAVHDYLPMRRSGVMDAVNGFTKCHMIAPWFVTRELIPTAFWVKQ